MVIKSLDRAFKEIFTCLYTVKYQDNFEITGGVRFDGNALFMFKIYHLELMTTVCQEKTVG